LVRTTPRNIPEKIVIDVSNLDIGDVLHVRDIKAPEGVKIMTHPEEVVAVVSEPEAEEVSAEEGEGATA
jgi:large subunit ribosomal protein L25